MRILHTADWHLGKSLEKRSRIDEQRKFLDDFIEIAKENGYDVEEAKKLLKEAGCKDTDNDGILEKDGKKLSFDKKIQLRPECS